jgi:hypothetical protein
MGSLDLEVLATSRLPPSKRHAVVRLGHEANSLSSMVGRLSTRTTNPR